VSVGCCVEPQAQSTTHIESSDPKILFMESSSRWPRFPTSAPLYLVVELPRTTRMPFFATGTIQARASPGRPVLAIDGLSPRCPARNAALRTPAMMPDGNGLTMRGI
jgi:hypothetical protein